MRCITQSSSARRALDPTDGEVGVWKTVPVPGSPCLEGTFWSASRKEMAQRPGFNRQVLCSFCMTSSLLTPHGPHWTPTFRAGDLSPQNWELTFPGPCPCQGHWPFFVGADVLDQAVLKLDLSCLSWVPLHSPQSSPDQDCSPYKGGTRSPSIRSRHYLRGYLSVWYFPLMNSSFTSRPLLGTVAAT